MSIKIPKLNQSLSHKEKTEILNQLYISAFESFKKYGPRKDKKNQEIKEACILLKDPATNFSTYSQIKKYSLLFAQPFENIPLKNFEKILSITEEIIMNTLVDSSILQEMVELILNYLYKFSNLNDDFINIKILNLCYLIYSCDPISSIHYKNMKKIVIIALNIFISSVNIQCQASAHATLSNIIDYMMKKINFLYKEAKSASNKNISFKKSLLPNNNDNDIQDDNINSFCHQYINYLVDIVAINRNYNKEDKENDLISLYIASIMTNTEQANNAFINKIKEKIEKDNENKNEINVPIGKCGWCFSCRNGTNDYNKLLNIPLCSNQECERSLIKLASSIDADNKMYNSVYRKDFITTLFSLTKISTKDAKEETVRIRNKEFCLSIIQEMINKGSIYFSNDTEIIHIIKENLIDSLFKNTLSNEINNNVFKISFSAFLIIIKKFRSHLKDQIEIFINKVLVSILESENLGYAYKEVVLDGLIQLANDCEFLVEIYVNFDCDINYKAIFYELINLITKIINGMYKKPKYANLLKQMQESSLRSKSLDFLLKFIKNLSDLVEKNEIKNMNTVYENTTPVINEGSVPDSNSVSEEGNPSMFDSTSSTFIGEIKEKINQNLKMKALLTKAIEKFNIYGHENCFNFLLNQKMIYDEETFNSIKEKFIYNVNSNSKLHRSITTTPTEDDNESNEQFNIMQTPFISNINPLIYLINTLDKESAEKLSYENFKAFEIARFFRSNINELNKNIVGGYLCSGKAFNIKVVQYFIDSFNFKKVHILEAMRLLFNELYLLGEGQIVDRIVQIFGEKYHKENPSVLKNPDLSYYLAFSIIMLNTDLHREEVEKKMTLTEYSQRLLQMCPNEKIDDKYLADLYKKVLTNPLVMPGQKLSTNKTKKELIKQEKDSILRSTFAKLQNVSITANSYVCEVNNYNIRHLMECSWSNFLSIFSQLLNDEENSEQTTIECVKQILLLARICGMLHLDTITEAFINTIINTTNLVDGKEISYKNVNCIRELMHFLVNNGQYIRRCWFSLLSSISKIDYYQTTPLDEFIVQIKQRSKNKNIEKECEIELKNRDIISKTVNDTFCVNIFCKTANFDEEAIVNFVDSLCKVSIDELTLYYYPRVFSLHKLGEVAEFNIFRIQVEWVKIWNLISSHLVYVILNSKQENIWSEALESLRQIVCKLVQKQDLTTFNFQIDFFKPFEKIYEQTLNFPKRGETVMVYIHHIVGSYAEKIHKGWVIIFNILKVGLTRKDDKMTEDIKNTLIKICDNFMEFGNKVELEAIKGFLECLCTIHLEDKYRQISNELAVKLLSQILKSMDKTIDKEEEKKKRREFIKLFLYGFDDLTIKRPNEHLNLLFDCLMKNKEELFCRDGDLFTFIYAYYKFFKPHLVTLIMYFNIQRKEYYHLDKENGDNINLMPFEFEYDFNKNVFENVKSYLEESLGYTIKKLEENEKDNKKVIAGLKKIQNDEDNEQDFSLIQRKIRIIDEFYTANPTSTDEKYKTSIGFFLNKFNVLTKSLSESKKQIISYFQLYEDLISTIHSLSFISSKCYILYPILSDNCSNQSFSSETLSKIDKINNIYISILSKSKSKLWDEDSKKNEIPPWVGPLLLFNSSFIEFYFIFLEKNPSLLSQETISELYHKVSTTLLKHIQFSLAIPTLIENTPLIHAILSLQNIKHLLLSTSLSPITSKNPLNTLILLKTHFLKQVTKINITIKNELDNIIPFFLLSLQPGDLETLFDTLLELVDTSDDSLRKSSKQILKQFLTNKLIKFVSVKNK